MATTAPIHGGRELLCSACHLWWMPMSLVMTKHTTGSSLTLRFSICCPKTDVPLDRPYPYVYRECLASVGTPSTGWWCILFSVVVFHNGLLPWQCRPSPFKMQVPGMQVSGTSSSKIWVFGFWEVTSIFCSLQRSLTAALLHTAEASLGTGVTAYWFPIGNNGVHKIVETDTKVGQTLKPEPIAVPVISVEELREATDNFGPKSLIGEGSYGRVYYSTLRNGRAAAVKKLDASKQPDQEFLAQVSMVSRLKHENVLELVGYCVDGGSRMLAYEFATMGSLHDILHVPDWSHGYFGKGFQYSVMFSKRSPQCGELNVCSLVEALLQKSVDFDA
eukprot:Gb_11896 [translate_table: standard]